MVQNYPESLKVKTLVSLIIHASPADVFPWIEDPDKAILWQKNIKEATIIEEAEGKTGTKFREVLEENGKELEMYGEIIAYIPDCLIAFQLESKVHNVEVKYTVTEQDNSTFLSVHSSITWKFPMNLISFFIRRKIRNNILQQIDSELQELKRLCEPKIIE